jgi:hypothetical protein
MAEQVAVSGFNIPPVPTGATVHEHSREGGAQPSPAARANVAQPHEQEFRSLSQPAAAPQAPATAPASTDPTLLALLAALTGNKEAAAPAPAQAPAPVQAPQYSGDTDPVTSSLTGILSSAGLDVHRAIGNALTHGDASLIDTRYIAEAGGAAAAHLTAVAQGLITHAVNAENALANSVYTQAGGEANWRAALGAFEKSAPGHLQTIVKSLYDTKNPSNVDAATKTILEFAKQAGVQITQAGVFGGGAAGGNVQALDKASFQAELLKLDKNSRGYEQARGELFGRRQAGKQLGYN